jgi:hypothetical protein
LNLNLNLTALSATAAANFATELLPPEQQQQQTLVLTPVTLNHDQTYQLPQQQQLLQIQHQQPAQHEENSYSELGNGYNIYSYNDSPPRFCDYCESSSHTIQNCFKRSIAELQKKITDLTTRPAQQLYAPPQQYFQQYQAPPGNFQQPAITYPAAGYPQGSN